jgi:hypothetical protein
MRRRLRRDQSTKKSNSLAAERLEVLRVKGEEIRGNLK